MDKAILSYSKLNEDVPLRNLNGALAI